MCVHCVYVRMHIASQKRALGLLELELQTLSAVDARNQTGSSGRDVTVLFTVTSGAPWLTHFQCSDSEQACNCGHRTRKGWVKAGVLSQAGL